MTETPPAWHALFAVAGGREGLARILGTTESTIWRWSRGHVVPAPIVRDAVNRMCIEHGLTPVFSEVDHHGKQAKDSRHPR